MTVYTENDIIYAEIAYTRQGVPVLNAILKKDATPVGPDDTITITSFYSGNGEGPYKDITSDFESDEIGTKGTDIGYVDYCSHPDDIEIIYDYIGRHGRHLRFISADVTVKNFYDTFSYVTSGTVEFYMKVSDATPRTTVSGRGPNGASYVGPVFYILNDKICDKDDNVLDDFVDNTWYHIKMVFTCATHTYDLYLNGDLIGDDLPFLNTIVSNVWQFSWGIYSTTLYVDAVGYSWDVNYDVGDNLTYGDGSHPDQEIFNGYIEDVDMNSPQGIYAISKLREIKEQRPTTGAWGFTESIIAQLIYEKCNIINKPTYNETSTLNLYPTGDQSKGNWLDDVGNNNGYLWDDIDDDPLSPDSDKIQTHTDFDECDIIIDNHSLSAEYHYQMIALDTIYRGRCSMYDQEKMSEALYDGKGWIECTEVYDFPITGGNHYVDWSEYVKLYYTAADFNNFRFKIKANNTITDTIMGEALRVSPKFRYYTNMPKVDKGTVSLIFDLAGEFNLSDIFNVCALSELKTWYIDANNNMSFNDGDLDSGIKITTNSKTVSVEGTRQIKTFDKVILFGGYVGASRLVSVAGTGNKIAKETYGAITDQTILDALASQILTEKGVNRYDITLCLADDTAGLIQVGQTINIGSGIYFDNSSIEVPTNDYIIDKAVLFLGKEGVYDHIELKLLDYLVFSIPEEKKEDQNEKNIAETQINVSQVSAGEGGTGEANVGQNIGTDGVGVYSGKSGATLQFHNIAPASSKITVTENAEDIDIDVAQDQLIITEAQISDLGSYLENVVEDTSPQLGGNLDLNTKSILVNGTLPSDGTYEGFVVELTNSVTFGKVVYVSSANTVSQCDKDTINLAIGISVGTNKVLIFGTVREDDWDWASYIGKPIYIGDDGNLTGNISGYSTGDLVQVIGVALDSNSILVKGIDWVEVA